MVQSASLNHQTAQSAQDIWLINQLVKTGRKIKREKCKMKQNAMSKSSTKNTDAENSS